MGHVLLVTRMIRGSKVLIRQQKLFYIHVLIHRLLINTLCGPILQIRLFTRSVARQALQGVNLIISVPEPSP